MPNGSILSIFSELRRCLIPFSGVGVSGAASCVCPLALLSGRTCLGSIAMCLVIATSLISLIETSIVIGDSESWIILRQGWTSTLSRCGSTGCTTDLELVSAARDCSTRLRIVVGLS